MFNIYEFYEPSQAHYAELIDVWEASVRATHGFLNEEDILFYKSLLSTYLPELELYCIDLDGGIAAFMALGDNTVQALFVHPKAMGKGIGKALMLFALKEKSIYKVYVNEQNTDALNFYQHLGFQIRGRSELDSTGRPYPILHLVYQNERI